MGQAVQSLLEDRYRAFAFLEFEKWWGGYFFLNKKEIEWIVQNLFVGNKLSANEVKSADGKTTVNLYNIRSPIVVFASWGDNITPPQQALNWIPDLYESVDEIRAHDQTIVYCLHEKIGHLGIFVSRKSGGPGACQIMGAIDMIDALPPGTVRGQNRGYATRYASSRTDRGTLLDQV